MKMRHLKKFENFSDPDDMGRFSGESDEQEWLEHIKGKNNQPFEEEEELCTNCGSEGCPECDNSFEEEEEIVKRRKVWGDEVIEKRKFNFEKSKKVEKKGKKSEENGLSPSQKKLPAGLQKAIASKKKK